MAKPSKFYAVKVGKQTGIFESWYSSFQGSRNAESHTEEGPNTRAEADAWMAGTDSVTSPTATTSDSADKGKKRMRTPEVDEDGWDVVYSDGACKGNGQVGSFAGVGVWWGNGDPRNIAERCPGDQTNNRAELIAILRVLETTPPSKKPLLIKTDSTYSRKCFQEWLPKWRTNGFRTSTGDPVKNAALIRYLSAHLDARAPWAKSADSQANLGALKDPVGERNWARLEKELKERLEAEFRGGADRPESVPPEVGDESGVIELGGAGESPTKVRKTAHKPTSNSNIAVEPLKPSSRSAPQVPRHSVVPQPAIIQSSASTSNSQFSAEDLAQYADGLLDDKDITADLSD
ncbi:Ribonuclease H [Mycena venus]|uniref:ribonuclease H n=1 Tax=Mycena venus TaxID=2733690 RepID=A0A8H7CRF1_9AGAR|nr:Ribonuclease H [Mycena venus]